MIVKTSLTKLSIHWALVLSFEIFLLSFVIVPAIEGDGPSHWPTGRVLISTLFVTIGFVYFAIWLGCSLFSYLRWNARLLEINRNEVVIFGCQKRSFSCNTILDVVDPGMPKWLGGNIYLMLDGGKKVVINTAFAREDRALIHSKLSDAVRACSSYV